MQQQGLPIPPKVYVEKIIKDKSGNYIGEKIGGAKSNIRTVPKNEYQMIKNSILKNATPSSNYGSKRSLGTWYDLPNGGRVGIRISNNYGETMDFDIPGIPSGFKIHQR